MQNETTGSPDTPEAEPSAHPSISQDERTEAAPASPEDALAKAREDAQKYMANWQRAEADFQNYKKRTEQERDELRRFGNVSLIINLLPVIDDFERAFSSLDSHLAGLSWFDGMYLIYRKLSQLLENAGVRPAKDFDLSRLRAMGSTGSPLAPYLHRWAREEVGALPLWSMSGGTDIAGAFVGGAPTVPIWPGEISVRCLGVAMEAWDEQGHPVYDEVGELVVHRPMPSMPVFLWDDPDRSRYTEAYFSTFPGAWRQGDWITINERGSVVIHGRSDSTLNRNGVRMGSADIYAAVETIPEVTEALVIGAEQADGTYWMPLFVVLDDGLALDDALVERIRRAIREKASPRHVPDEVIAVPGIPHTRTGKKLEVPVKRILQGAPPDRVANPDAVDDATLLRPFVDLAAERSAPAGAGRA
jgi:acetoacetyl-CoA synthase